MPVSPISPRRFKKTQALRQEVASSDSSFSTKMEKGIVVTKYSRNGYPAQRILLLEPDTNSVVWHELSSQSPGRRRGPSLVNLVRGQREALPLSHLKQVRARNIWEL
ncbi:unnamed protein product [Choristocarpus tenellus]